MGRRKRAEVGDKTIVLENINWQRGMVQKTEREKKLVKWRDKEVNKESEKIKIIFPGCQSARLIVGTDRK